MDPDRQRHTLDLDPESRPHQQRWVLRPDGELPPDDSWAEMTVDLGDPMDRISSPEDFVDEHPLPRRASVIVGGMSEVLDLVRASDKWRAKFMQRDLRWLNGIVEAAGMELVLVRDAVEDD